ncbi:Gamma-tubulin complex component 5 [Thoreauomyces humboldtii]|nr:Gamma-tubulin complex component 5 [Thoreauomyces humboldtii]
MKSTRGGPDEERGIPDDPPTRRQSAQEERTSKRKAGLSALVVRLSGDTKGLDGVEKLALGHNYQETNEHEVTKRYRGLAEKFAMHGSEKTGDIMLSYLERVVQLHSQEKLRVVYDVLRLLLETSIAPTQRCYVPKERRPMEDAPLTWTTILQEEPLAGSHWDVSIEEEASESNGDWSSDQEHSANALGGGQGTWAAPRSEQPASPTLPEDMEAPDSAYVNYEVGTMGGSSEGDADEESIAGLRALRNAQYWRHPVQGNDVLHQTTNLPSELDLVRETLFMLSGSSTPVFQVADDGVVDLNNVPLVLNHASQGALRSQLRWFAEKGTFLCRTRLYIERVTSEWTKYTSTEQGFAGSLLREVERADREIAALEEHYQKHRRAMPVAGAQDAGTLLDLRSRWIDLATLFESLQDVLLPVIRQESTGQHTPSTTASKLLSLLAAQVTQAELIRQPKIFNVYLELFAASIRPYLDITHRWIYEGVIEDPLNEFFIVEDAAAANVDLWSNRYRLREADNSARSFPAAFSDIWQDILSCGKSLRLLELVDPKQAVRFRSVAQPSLYDQVIGPLLRSKVVEDPNPMIDRPSDTGIMGDNIGTAFKLTSSALLGSSRRSQASEETEMVPQKGWQSALEVTRGFLQDCVQQQHETVGRQLTRILFRKCRLQEHLYSLQSICLMTAGSVMHPFCTALFEKARSGELVNKPQFMNASFRECLLTYGGQEFNFIDRSNVTFAIAPIPASYDQPTASRRLHAITIVYEVPPFLTAIITPASIEIYNEVARVLLRIKYAQQCIYADGWGWNRGATPVRAARGVIARRQAAVKARLVHFVSNLHSFFMGAVIHAECNGFSVRLREAQGMDQLIHCHDVFIRAVRDRCLLNGSARSIWTPMSAVLGLAVRYADVCRQHDLDVETAAMGGQVRQGDVATREAGFAEELQVLAERTETLVRTVQKDLEGLASHGVGHLEALAAALAW